MDKAVRGAVKPKVAAPKQKYLNVLIRGTGNDIHTEEIFKSLKWQLKSPSWSIIFKCLVVIHMLLRQGEGDRVMKYLASSPSMLDLSAFKDKTYNPGAVQTKNIHLYAQYLEAKVAAYQDLKVDFVRARQRKGSSRLRNLTVEKGLLRHIRVLQRQLGILLTCKFPVDDLNNEITLTAFKLLVEDVLVLLPLINEGVINMLEHFFEMSRFDAEEALERYKTFQTHTEESVTYLSFAKKYERHLGYSIPSLRNSPRSLTKTLEDYLKDPDFEANRKAYHESKKTHSEKKKESKSVAASSSNKPAEPTTATRKETMSAASSATAPPAATSSAAAFSAIPPSSQQELFDFFSSIEQEQTLIFDNVGTYNMGSFGPSTTNPFLALHPQQTGLAATQQQFGQVGLSPVGATDSNPFRASVYAPVSVNPTGPYNPFQQPTLTGSTNPFTHLSPTLSPISSMHTGSSVGPVPSLTTGSTMSTASSLSSMPPQLTGFGGAQAADSNPFRRAGTVTMYEPQGAFVPSATGPTPTNNPLLQNQFEQKPVGNLFTGGL